MTIDRLAAPAAALASLALLGGCVIPSSWRHSSPDPAPQPGSSPAPVAASAEAPAQIEVGFIVESALRARRPRRGQPDLLLELGNGATAIDGDRLQIQVRTSRDAYLYLAFCSQHASDPRYAGLVVFPDRGAIRVTAFETTVAPNPAAEIVLDNQPGQESLYLIFSRIELSRADTELADAIAAARQGNQTTDCGAALKTTPARSTAAGKPLRVWNGKPTSPKRRSARNSELRPRDDDPVVEIQRGGDIVWKHGEPVGLDADPDGIVVLRFGLNHVAAQ